MLEEFQVVQPPKEREQEPFEKEIEKARHFLEVDPTSVSEARREARQRLYQWLNR
jgi:hypothetical protein